MSRQSEKDEAATDEAMGYFNPQSMAIKRQPLGLILKIDFKKKKKKHSMVMFLFWLSCKGGQMSLLPSGSHLLI